MNQPLRCGLIGGGGIGDRHLKAFEALEREGLAKLVCVADPAVERLAAIKLALEKRGVHWYANYQQMLEESDLNAVSIATPIPMHSRMAAAVLARGRFVYLEKPPVPLIQQLIDLTALDHRQKVSVGFQLISSSQIRQLKKWKVEGALGTIQRIFVSASVPKTTAYYQRADWAGKMMLNEEPVFDGPATNGLSHLLHSVMYLAGEGFEEFDLPVEVEGELYRARPLESYDVACMRGRTTTDVSFCLALTHAAEASPFHLEIIGSKGRAWVSKKGEEVGNDCGLTSPLPPYSDAFFISCREFVEFAKGNRSRAVTRLVDTRGYMLLSNGILISSGGIHSIDPQYLRTVGQGGEERYVVEGLAELIRRSTSEGKLFSEMDVPWARRGNVISVRSLRSVRLQDYMSH
jgi:predicted dehydrogenase